MSSPWKIESPTVVNLGDIMSEEYAKSLQAKERKKVDDDGGGVDVPDAAMIISVAEEENAVIECPQLPVVGVPTEVLQALAHEPDYAILAGMDSDAKIAQVLQQQFDQEHDTYLKKVEQVRNNKSKVQISYSKYRINPEGMLEDSDQEEEKVPPEARKDWDRFDTNEKEGKLINKKKGYSVDEGGELKTKHDLDIAGRRNACKVMSFPPEFPTGDGAAFDMKLNNTVFNQLKAATTKKTKKYKAGERKEEVETAVMGMDERTRMILFKQVDNAVLESVDGVISTGKEAAILHAFSDPSNTELTLPKEVAIKVFSTTLNEFKQRDRYIKDDYRFKDRFSKQNSRTIIKMWAEKEFHNLNRLAKAGIACPTAIILKEHVLIMSFIGKNSIPAPKIKEIRLSDADWSVAYEEIIQIMHKMYNEAKLVHADFSEYNILYLNGKCWVIDVAQAVEPTHPGALEYLMRDCGNIVDFFSKKGVPNVPTKEELFFSITGMDPLTHNATNLERIYMKGAPSHIITSMTETDEVPDRFKPLVFPFDLAWEKVAELKHNDPSMELTDALRELKYQEI